MCGILGLLLESPNNGEKLRACLIRKISTRLAEMQHRGYDGAGLAVNDLNEIKLFKGVGLVKDVLTEEIVTKQLAPSPEWLQAVKKSGGSGLALVTSRSWYPKLPFNLSSYSSTHHQQQSPSLTSPFGIGHVRYKTKGDCTHIDSQPLRDSTGYFCLVHNGQIETEHHLPDSRYFLELLEQNLTPIIDQSSSGVNDLTNEQVFQWLSQQVFPRVQGSYSCLLMIAGWGLVAFRDPLGIRPLVYGRFQSTHDWDADGGDLIGRALNKELVEHWVASENVNWGGGENRDVLPGECLILRPNQPVASYQWSGPCSLQPCIFEYIYLAHPTSQLNGLSVKVARQTLGQLMAERISQIFVAEDKNMFQAIIPVPETSVIAAEKISEMLGVPLEKKLKLNPNRKLPRSFILPTQADRVKAVQDKFLWVEEGGEEGSLSTVWPPGATILVVDDSIIRGTTLRCLLKMIRTQCPTIGEIWVASLAPPVRYRNIRGIDIPNEELLVAAGGKTEKEIALELGADRVIYQDLSTMVYGLMGASQQKFVGFELGMFTGHHLY